MCQAFDAEYRWMCEQERKALKCHWCGRPAVLAPPFNPVRCNRCHNDLIAKDHPWKFGREEAADADPR